MPDGSSFARKLAAAAIGGVTAAFAGPVIAAYGGSMLVATLGASLVGSTLTTVSENAMKPSIKEVRYYPRRAQLDFRNAVSRFLNVHFDPVIERIRRNLPSTFGPMNFSVSLSEISGVMSFAYENNSSIFIEYAFKVHQRAGTGERSLEDSEEPPPLPEYISDEETAPYPLPSDLQAATDSVFDGLGWALVRGAAVGAIGGFGLLAAPGWYFIETAPGVGGIILGVPSVVGGASSAAEIGFSDLTPHQKIAFSVNFASEIRLNMNRVIQCANQNGVELEYHIKAGVGKAIAVVGNRGPVRRSEWLQVWYEDQSHLL